MNIQCLNKLIPQYSLTQYSVGIFISNNDNYLDWVGSHRGQVAHVGQIRSSVYYNCRTGRIVW